MSFRPTEIFVRLRSLVLSRALPRILGARQTVQLVRLGSDYGGWWIPVGAARPGKVAYLGGAGEDITFDVELHRRGCLVRTLDPTPRAITHVQAAAPTDDAFKFMPVGLWDEDTTLRFYAPRVAEHVSHSVVNLQETSTYFEAEVVTLRTALRRVGDTQLDLLKLDIEGAEHAVVRDVVQNGPSPEVICLEFDQPCPLSTMRATSSTLRAAGYSLEKVDGWNCTFVRRADDTWQRAPFDPVG